MDTIDKLIYEKPVEVLDMDKVQLAYRSVFNSLDGELILKDLIQTFRLQQFGCTGDKEFDYYKQGQSAIINQIKVRLYADYSEKIDEVAQIV